LRAAYSPNAAVPRQAETSEATTAAVRQLFAVVERYPVLKSATNVVDLVKVLQESLNRSQSLKPKRASGRNGGRSTTALVKQKRRAAA